VPTCGDRETGKRKRAAAIGRGTDWSPSEDKSYTSMNFQSAEMPSLCTYCVSVITVNP